MAETDFRVNNVIEDDVVVEDYGLGGEILCVEHTDDQVVARLVHNKTTGRKKCYALRDRKGSLYDPLTGENDYNNHYGRRPYELARISEEGFTLYLRFFETGRPVDLRQAERAG